MKRYLILITYQPWDWGSASEEVRQEFFAQHAAFSAYVEEHGHERSGAALGDVDTATTVRHVDGQPVVTDGPFAELSEVIGGVYDVELPDLDTAIEATKLLPTCYTLEIRPVVGVT